MSGAGVDQLARRKVGLCLSFKAIIDLSFRPAGVGSVELPVVVLSIATDMARAYARASDPAHALSPATPARHRHSDPQSPSICLALLPVSHGRPDRRTWTAIASADEE
jgi:hypothetical protein